MAKGNKSKAQGQAEALGAEDRKPFDWPKSLGHLPHLPLVERPGLLVVDLDAEEEGGLAAALEEAQEVARGGGEGQPVQPIDRCLFLQQGIFVREQKEGVAPKVLRGAWESDVGDWEPFF